MKQTIKTSIQPAPVSPRRSRFTKNWAMPAALLLAGISLASAPLTNNFSDGNDSDPTPLDQYPSAAGNGWAAGWVSQLGASATLVAGVVTNPPDGTPLNGGGNYLRWQLGGGTAASTIRRQFNPAAGAGTPAIDITKPYVIELDYRMDVLLAAGVANSNSFNNASDQITISQNGADKIAQRKRCLDFEQFEPLFKQCHVDLAAGVREARGFTGEQQIQPGHFFILHGITAYVAEVGEKEVKNGKVNARLRCIFENGTESNMLLRSLATELYKDETGRRILAPHEKALEALEQIQAGDEKSGYLYVLQSLSTVPEIAGTKNLFKIGYSTVPVPERIKNAAEEPTYLLAPVKVISVFECYNLNPQKFELLLHTFFGKACLLVDV